MVKIEDLDSCCPAALPEEEKNDDAPTAHNESDGEPIDAEPASQPTIENNGQDAGQTAGQTAEGESIETDTQAIWAIQELTRRELTQFSFALLHHYAIPNDVIYSLLIQVRSTRSMAPQPAMKLKQLRKLLPIPHGLTPKQLRVVAAELAVAKIEDVVNKMLFACGLCGNRFRWIFENAITAITANADPTGRGAAAASRLMHSIQLSCPPEAIGVVRDIERDIRDIVILLCRSVQSEPKNRDEFVKLLEAAHDTLGYTEKQYEQERNLLLLAYTKDPYNEVYGHRSHTGDATDKRGGIPRPRRKHRSSSPSCRKGGANESRHQQHRMPVGACGPAGQDRTYIGQNSNRNGMYGSSTDILPAASMNAANNNTGTMSDTSARATSASRPTVGDNLVQRSVSATRGIREANTSEEVGPQLLGSDLDQEVQQTAHRTPGRPTHEDAPMAQYAPPRGFFPTWGTYGEWQYHSHQMSGMMFPGGWYDSQQLPGAATHSYTRGQGNEAKGKGKNNRGAKRNVKNQHRWQ